MTCRSSRRSPGRTHRRLAVLLATALAAAPILSGCATNHEDLDAQVDYHYRLGMAHLQDNNPQAALVQFREAVKVDKNSTKAQFALGHAFFLLDDTDSAEAAMKRVVKIEPENGEAINYLGNIYEREGHPEKALAAFKQATLSTTYLTPHFAYRNMARVHRALKMEEAAEADLKTALKRVPEYYPARADLGKLYMDQGRWDEAVKEWSTLLDLNPEINDAHFYLAQTYLGGGDAEQARREAATFVLQADKGNQLLIEAQAMLQKLGGGGGG
jgi:Tfp pilus assembly protein PilF